MYHRYFGLKHRPFTATPHTGACYPAATQEEALATLHYAITQGRGIAVLTGLPGTGKTLVCHRLTTNLEPAFTTAMITNTHMPTVKGLLQAILYDLSLPFHGLEEQELRLTLTDFLLGKYAGGGRTVLVIDEAQNLSVPLLEELRMLSNLEGESDKLFQIVLAGHPRLLQGLRSPELETLSQRIGARAMLAPLTDEETVSYIQHQLELAGVRSGEIFSYEAMYAVHELTNGIPRLISQLSDHALLRAYVAELRQVDRATVVEAKADLDQSDEHRTMDSGGAVPSMRATESKVVADRAIRARSVNQGKSKIEIDEMAEMAETFVACTELEGSLETMQISTDRVSEASHANAAKPNKVRVAMLDSALPSDGYSEEEIVIDPYAMMDAIRTGSRKTKQSRGIGQTDTDQSTTGKTSIELDRSRTGDSQVVPSDPAIAAKTGAGGVLDTYAPEGLFVESTDNAAVHEVGAGVADPPRESTEPPILVIENRQQRIGSHITRVDAAQQSGRDNRGYRRLFTHARKS